MVIAPRKMWPQALANLGLDLRGRISDPALPGRAIARLTDLGHGQALRELFRGGDQPVPAALGSAAMQVLKDWSGGWPVRPTAIVHVESATRPSLTVDLAEGISRVMRIPVVGRFAIVDPSIEPGRGATNSAQRVAAVSRRSRFEGAVEPGASVLLVDDLIVTGWTMTLAARALRQAGAEHVLPFALGTQA